MYALNKRTDGNVSTDVTSEIGGNILSKLTTYRVH